MPNTFSSVSASTQNKMIDVQCEIQKLQADLEYHEQKILYMDGNFACRIGSRINSIIYINSKILSSVKSLKIQRLFGV